MLLEGIFPAITTPFFPDGRLYLHKLERNVEHYSRTPVAGLAVLGSTGEAVMLSDEETRHVLRAAREAAAADKLLIAGVARESLTETLCLADYAAGQQYDAVLVRTPHYYASQMQPLEMLTFYRALADRSPLPVILYSIPKFTHYELPVELVAELAQHPNIVGIKDSSGSPERLSALVAATRAAPKRSVAVTPTFAAVTGRMLLDQPLAEGNFIPADILGTDASAVAVAPPRPAIKMRSKEVGFQVMNGSAEKLLPAFEAGAVGSILAFAVCAPQACQEIWLAWKENDPKLAAEKQERILPASRIVAARYGIPGLKYACDLNGYYGGVPRIPLLPLNAQQKEEVETAMSDLRH